MPTEAGPNFDTPPREMTRAAFVAYFGGVYESSPWIAEAAWEAGLTNAEDSSAGLHAALRRVVEAAPRDRQLGLVRAHPDLAGRAAVAGDLTPQSAGEQAAAGLDHCTPDEFQRFQDLNDRYKARFGFPFVIAVKGLTRADILAAFERRIEGDPQSELRTALLQIHEIARLRLTALAAQGKALA
jgi:OHCU decarboxylase